MTTIPWPITLTPMGTLSGAGVVKVSHLREHSIADTVPLTQSRWCLWQQAQDDPRSACVRFEPYQVPPRCSKSCRVHLREQEEVDERTRRIIISTAPDHSN